MHHSSLLQNAYVHKPRLHPEPRQSYINGTAISSTVGHLHASPWFKNTSAFLPSLPLYTSRAAPSCFPPLFPPSLAHLPSPSRGQASEAVSSLFRGRWKERVRGRSACPHTERGVMNLLISQGVLWKLFYIPVSISLSRFPLVFLPSGGGSESGVDCRS